MRGKDGAIAGQAETKRLSQAIHRIGGEHAGAGAAGRAGGTLDFVEISLGNRGIRSLDHRIDEIKVDYLPLHFDLARFHRATGNKNHRNIEAHGSHQHTRGDLVAVGNTDHRIGAMGVHHVLHRIGNQIA